jgi:hypothetical protein
MWNIVESGIKHHNPNPGIDKYDNCIEIKIVICLI